MCLLGRLHLLFYWFSFHISFSASRRLCCASVMKVEGQLFPPSRLAFEQFFFWFFYPAWHHEIDSTREKIPSYCPSISVLENTTVATFLEISEPFFFCASLLFVICWLPSFLAVPLFSIPLIEFLMLLLKENLTSFSWMRKFKVWMAK